MNAHPEDILAPKSTLNVADGDGFMLLGSQYKTNHYWQGSEGLPGFGHGMYKEKHLRTWEAL